MLTAGVWVDVCAMAKIVVRARKVPASLNGLMMFPPVPLCPCGGDQMLPRGARA
jgi:hypothetical protein